jgi:MGT family glycosyltransferase
MPEPGHFQALRAVIARLVAHGFSTYVFTHPQFEDQVTWYGGRFVDLFAAYPIEAADDESRPIPCRYVSFAGAYAGDLIDDVRRLGASLIVYDTFAVVGPVVARALGIPYVSVSACHNLNPERALALLRDDPRVEVSEKCHRAVDRLRTLFDLGQASPFSYVASLSPFLNIYCEPPEFLDEADRAPFRPIAFFGCLPDTSPPPADRADLFSRFDGETRETLRVYVSFGTVVWRYYAEQAAAALAAIAKACSDSDRLRAIISLAGADVDPGLATSLTSDHVQVLPLVDQPSVLERADLFVTHHGLNSTHEAIFKGAAMISYPFFSDQPVLARKCQELGLALPLTEQPLAPVSAKDVNAAVSSFDAARDTIGANLARAATWERQTMARRDAVTRRIADLVPTG